MSLDKTRQTDQFNCMKQYTFLTLDSDYTSFNDLKATCTTTPNRMNTETNEYYSPEKPHKKTLSGYLNQKNKRRGLRDRGTYTDNSSKSNKLDRTFEGYLKFNISMSPQKSDYTKPNCGSTKASFKGKKVINPLSQTMNLSTVKFGKFSSAKAVSI